MRPLMKAPASIAGAALPDARPKPSRRDKLRQLHSEKNGPVYVARPFFDLKPLVPDKGGKFDSNS